MELGVMFESEASGSGRSGPGYIHADLLRAAVAEFIGMMLFLFFGEPGSFLFLLSWHIPWQCGLSTCVCI